MTIYHLAMIKLQRLALRLQLPTGATTEAEASEIAAASQAAFTRPLSDSALPAAAERSMSGLLLLRPPTRAFPCLDR